jgi:hypothetical protein
LNLFEKTLINQALSKNIEIFENTDIQYELNFESHCVGH